MVKLRLKRYGKKQQPTYRIVAIESSFRREGRAFKEVGIYIPKYNKTQLNVPAIIELLKNGAQPTSTVKNILLRAQIVV
uniref:Small ribosomal subunit protein bS16c n=1 Tax=Chara vulgaris TaxID=55564 RepID=RR16_CHAVU|nr:ribosomal protein S16 [Chara vulgaris]Q1ACL1.1 RecName: Full=Small ribosomal subunit protein bS16c; AltName: Full=30S ribosomal protein S16, chloroplastic [Chara vulgaris]ABA61973.1 ribosomal protein S16 [Chara vulgaris]WAP91310.1 ribosomal protein S16 [Chara vulgaris]